MQNSHPMTAPTPFLTDLLAQPAALRDAVTHFDPTLLADLRAGKYERIVVTAMGGSHFAGVPAWLSLVSAGLPVWHIDASVLLHDAISLVNERTLLWVVSQSGRSAEIVALLDRVKPALLLALTNDASSPLAARADVVQLMHAGVEAVVSTKTYLNSLALTQLMALQLAGRPTDAARDELLAAADAVEAYLAEFDERQRSLGARVGVPERLFLLGRGASMAAVDAGALVLKEAAKINASGMSGPQFRHGPYEMADERVTALVLEGAGSNAALQRRRHRRHGAARRRRPGRRPAASARSRRRPADRRDSALSAADVPDLRRHRLRRRPVPPFHESDDGAVAADYSDSPL